MSRRSLTDLEPDDPFAADAPFAGPDDTRGPGAPAPLLTDIQGLSALLDRSVASLERDAAAGRLPRSIRIGGSRKWRVAEIHAWVAAGCPPLAQWKLRATT